MADVFRTLIVPDADVALARAVAATLDAGGVGMWTTPAAPTEDGAPTHWISSGWVPEGWQHLVPCQTWAQDAAGAWELVASTPGDQTAVLFGCQAGGLAITAEQVAALFAHADVTEQPPFDALARLGLVLVQAAP